MGLDVGAADEVEAVRHGGEDAGHGQRAVGCARTFERLANGGRPGRFTMRACPRTTAVCRDSSAVGTTRRLIWRICSPKPGSSRWATARVASPVRWHGSGAVEEHQ